MPDAVGSRRLDPIRSDKTGNGVRERLPDPSPAETPTRIRTCIPSASGLLGVTRRL